MFCRLSRVWRVQVARWRLYLSSRGSRGGNSAHLCRVGGKWLDGRCQSVAGTLRWRFQLDETSVIPEIRALREHGFTRANHERIISSCNIYSHQSEAQHRRAKSLRKIVGNFLSTSLAPKRSRAKEGMPPDWPTDELIQSLLQPHSCTTCRCGEGERIPPVRAMGGLPTPILSASRGGGIKLQAPSQSASSELSGIQEL